MQIQIYTNTQIHMYQVPVHPAHSLCVMTGVPAGVKDHNPVRSDQVHAKASRSRGHKEEFHLVVSGGLVDHLSGSCVSVSVFEVARYVSLLVAFF